MSSSVKLTCALLLAALPLFAQDAQDQPEAQADQPTSLQHLTWQAPADIIYPLPQLLTRGMLPVLHKGPDGKPVLSLVRLGDGQLCWTARIGEDPVAINANDSMIFAIMRTRMLGLSIGSGEALWQQPVEGMLDSGWQTPPQFAQMQWFADLYTVGQGMGGVIYCHQDKVYITCAGSIYALDGATGKNLWDAEYGFKLNYPLVGCGNVIISSSDLGLTGYDADSGNIAWEQRDITRATPLFVLGDVLYAQTDQAFLRIDPSDGSTVWSAAVPGGQAETVQLVEDRLVLRRNSDVWILDPSDGRTLFAAETGHQQSVIGDGRIFLHSAKGGDIYCYSVKDMQYVWHKPFLESGVGRLFYGAGILMGISGFDVAAYGPQDGRMLWRRRAPPGCLFDTNTWGANSTSLFFKANNVLAGCGSAGGAWSTAVEGNFFFVSWIWSNDTAVFVHCGDPGAAKVGGLIIKPQTQ